MYISQFDMKCGEKKLEQFKSWMIKDKSKTIRFVLKILYIFERVLK